VAEGPKFESERHYRVAEIHALDFKSLVSAYELGAIPGYKFIVIGDRLIIGDVNDHTMLALLDKYGASSALAEILKNKKAAFQSIRDDLRDQVIAAGETSTDGEVIGWASLGFQVWTPPELENGIQAAIAKTISAESGWAKKGLH